MKLFNKRLIDILFSFFALFFFLFPICAIFILIRLNLGKPGFFRQKRPGLLGKPFELIKFRTMTEILDSTSTLQVDEKRLNSFGKFLRKTSLDELPEFWNVLKGEMSLVGPRPLLMQYLDRYTPEQFRRHEMKPGITGWAQINGRNCLDWEERFKLDVWYINNWSLFLDLKILFLTGVNVIRQVNIHAPGHSTMPEFKGNLPKGL